LLTAVIAASAAIATLAVAVAVARMRRARAERRFESVLGHLDAHMSAISHGLQSVVERAESARASGVYDLELTVDFDELLRRIAAEAAARTNAQAAAVHVRGPGGEPACASFGGEDGVELIGAPMGAGARPFRAVTINWAYGPAAEQYDDSYVSALVVPIVEDGIETGNLAAYAVEPGVFGATHMTALGALAAEAGPAIASARRFAEAERALTDGATGLRNRKGYEAELDRAVARAHATGLPLSLLVLDLAESGDADAPADQSPALRELADLLLRVTRTTDVVCRRAPDELGIVLPETTGGAARRLYVRLREQAVHATFTHPGQVTFAAGLVEWRPDEPSATFDARAAAAVGNSRVDDLELVGAAPAMRLPDTPRAAFDVHLSGEVARARALRRPLAVIVLDVDVAGDEGARTEQAVDEAVEKMRARVANHLPNGDVSWRIGRDELAVILPGAAAADAERMLAALRSSLDDEPTGGDRPLVSAGITELTGGDDPADVALRAEHALGRARLAGRGTVVVAVAGDDPHR
jgi:diguanylate cyclase (GGDEF)-like protein